MLSVLIQSNLRSRVTNLVEMPIMVILLPSTWENSKQDWANLASRHVKDVMVLANQEVDLELVEMSHVHEKVGSAFSTHRPRENPNLKGGKHERMKYLSIFELYIQRSNDRAHSRFKYSIMDSTFLAAPKDDERVTSSLNGLVSIYNMPFGLGFSSSFI